MCSAGADDLSAETHRAGQRMAEMLLERLAGRPAREYAGDLGAGADHPRVRRPASVRRSPLRGKQTEPTKTIACPSDVGDTVEVLRPFRRDE